MKSRLKNFPVLILSLLFCSCVNNTAKSNKYFGVEIKNSLPTGTIYKTVFGEEFGFRSFNIYITNDSVIPINLKIALPNNFIELKSATKNNVPENLQLDSTTTLAPGVFKVFFLPDSLTNNDLYRENSLPTGELVLFLKHMTDSDLTLIKIIKPGEKCTLRLGFLFKPEGLVRSELFSNGHLLTLSIPEKEINRENTNTNILDLKLGVTLYSDYAIVPCGELFYSY